ncbi:hypothetical protein H5410_030826 [Solanum commersonii]|uniref:Putative plant transposon protein domain-containing protein n=1 Tax=Solanum commersonii TaxID=4109 RepID=A0A9J5YII6_SOLCO|nr:hypothetical protein H5410_030826 [Solanum commersonii]
MILPGITVVLRSWVWEIVEVIMLSSQRTGKKVATSSHRKHVRSGNVPLAPAVPKGQTRRFGVKFVTKEGKAWYKKHIEAIYFSDVCINRDNLAREFPQIIKRIKELRMEFIFAEPEECNLHMTKHSGKRYHQSLPYAHMLRETHIWLNGVMNCLILRFHYTNITHDRVCLVYALMTRKKLNIGAILKSAMRKARVHKGHKYAIGGLITKMCHAAGVPKENLDYMAPLFPAPVDITRTKGPDTEFGPTLTIVERHRCDELIMARMYILETLRHQNGCMASTDMQLGDVERRYLLNDHAKALLGIGPVFRELIDNDISTDEEHLRTSSDVESNSDEEAGPALAGDEAERDDAMED